MAVKPLAIDLCSGLGGWTDGFLAEDFRVIGVDLVASPGYAGDLVLQDILTLDGRRFREAMVIVASPPCTEFSRHDMPWTRARHPDSPDLSLVRACVRIAEEAGAPLVLENVRGLQMWWQQAVWHWGPYYLWGNGVPALMPGDVTRRCKESYSSFATAERAKIPFALANWVARCYASEAFWNA